jgi:5-methylcytosine-specific restriction endonuclease McrA
MPSPKRKSIPVPVQAEVFFRDGWLCHLCRRPVVLHSALRLLQEHVQAHLPDVPLAYWQSNWRRDAAPLLDELAASVDHVLAHARGGTHDLSNFATVCARCNARKSHRAASEYLKEARPWKVKGKHGEPTTWDGFSSLFVVLARAKPTTLTPTERAWQRAIEGRLRAPAG